jgi:hypothetical protein
MAVTTLGSPNFDPTPLATSSTTVSAGSIEIVNGVDMTAMVGETDPIFSAWDKHTGITIDYDQITTGSATTTPTGLTCSSQGISIGTQSAYVVLTWDAIVTSTFDHYHIRYKRSAFSAYSYIDSFTNTISIEGLIPNTIYNFGVASITKTGVVSSFCTDINVTTSLDTTLPATVAGVSATANIEGVILRWTNNSEADISSYNIWRYTSNVIGSAVQIANVATNYFYDGGLTGGQIQYYWLKAKDTSGNISASYSTVVSATPTTALTIGELETELGHNLEDIATINPVDGYINVNTVGTLQLDNNAVTEAKILDGAIKAAKTSIAAINPADGEINANKVGTTQIVTGSVTHALLDNAAIEANNLATDSVTGPAIQASAITAGKVAAGAITATHILTGALTARHITSHNFIVSEGTFTSNTPTDSISWASCKVVYNGVEYTITNGTCDVGDKHVYWELATPTVFLHSVSLPALTNDGFLVAYNNSGAHLLVWNSTVINGNRITTGSITATNMAANSITANAITAGAITAIKIAAGAVTANKITSYNFIMSEGSFSNNTPSTGRLSWTGVKVVYNGVEYSIADGNCLATDVYIYWVYEATTFSTSATLPALGNNDYVVATNGNTYYPAGTAVYLRANTIIDGNRIATGSITTGLLAAGCITANKIGALQITGAHIAAGTITAANIAAGTITATQLNAGAISATTVAATTGTIGAWNIDSNSIYSGVKVSGDGYAASIGDMTIKSDGSIHAKNFYIDADGDVSFTASSTSSISGVGFSIIDIGTWDMYTDANISVALPSFNQVRSVDVIIRTDNGLWVYALDTYAAGSVAGWWIINVAAGTIDLYRTAGGIFDQPAFATTPSGGRGYITVQYKV